MNTGGPAFPGTLLDWFAGQALAVVIADPAGSGCAEGNAWEAYQIATAMLAEKARREAVVKESSTTDHSPDAGKMIPDPFAEDALRQLASDVLPADIKDAASEERLTWCAEQVRAQVNTLEARNRELVERIKQLEEAGDGLQKASLVFLLSFVGDDYYADEGTPIRQVDPDASVQWEDPPTAGDHVQLQNAIDKWNQAVAAARAVLARAKEAKP